MSRMTRKKKKAKPAAEPRLFTTAVIAVVVPHFENAKRDILAVVGPRYRVIEGMLDSLRGDVVFAVCDLPEAQPSIIATQAHLKIHGAGRAAGKR